MACASVITKVFPLMQEFIQHDEAAK
jgi:hypothetical protein